MGSEKDNHFKVDYTYGAVIRIQPGNKYGKVKYQMEDGYRRLHANDIIKRQAAIAA